MRYGLVKYLLALLSCPLHLIAQNLFPNPGFEDINICVEFHAPCAPEGWFNVPATNHLVSGKQAVSPRLGHMLLLLPVDNVMPSFRNKDRFTYTMLTCPLVKDDQYQLSFFLHTGKQPFRGLDIYLTDKEPDIFSLNALASAFAIHITEADVDAEVKGWKHIHKTFRAAGTQRFAIWSNKPPQPYDYMMKDAMNSSGDIFYFIDEVILKSLSAQASCAEQQDNLRHIYAQNFRHSENKILKEIQDTVKLVKPLFIQDTVRIPDVLFEVNSALLKPRVKQILDSVIIVLRAEAFSKLEINGHTDNTGQLRSNEKLSEARAEAVKQYFIGQLPAFSDRIFSAGMGAQQPVADNRSPAGRSRNRRVELIITRLKSVRQ